jgi:hypothetical protein
MLIRHIVPAIKHDIFIHLQALYSNPDIKITRKGEGSPVCLPYFYTINYGSKQNI